MVSHETSDREWLLSDEAAAALQRLNGCSFARARRMAAELAERLTSTKREAA